MIEDVEARFTFAQGIEVHASVGGQRFDLETLRDLAWTIGRTPGASLEIAWPGQGRQDPEGKALCDAGVLESSGSIGGGYPAVSGPRCAELLDAVRDDARFEALRARLMTQLRAGGFDAMEGTKVREEPPPT